jgi:large subunit ribosomal protein L21
LTLGARWRQCGTFPRNLRKQTGALAMYAIIEAGGRQLKVSEGDVVRVELAATEDKTIKFDRVLLVGGGEGAAKIGAPIVAGATVSADVLGNVKGEKLMLQKHKRRKGYSKKQGHRQKLVEVKITGISA